MGEMNQIDVEPLSFLSLSVVLVFAIMVCNVGILKFKNGEMEGHSTENPNVAQNSNHSPIRGVFDSGECPICFEDYQFCCVTQCGHHFCSECIISYWRTTNGRLNCPCCRTRVTLLIAEFQNEETDPNIGNEVRIRHYELLDNFNSMHGMAQANSFMEQIQNTPRLLRALAGFYLRDPFRHGMLIFRAFITFRRILFIFVSVTYVLSPFDFIPEAMFGLMGLIDDLLVIMGLLMLVAGVFRGILVHRNRRHEHVD